jgi:catechol 2,3-dioxygenase-like lactoylglutathione lyase family enzyme
MTDTYPAFEVSPVPTPGPDTVAPEPFHGIYGMPMFVSVPTSDLAGSTDFWVRGLGFFELFSAPGQVVHLRRWMFQDVLLVPADLIPAESAGTASTLPTVSFACVFGQVDEVAAACRSIDPDAVTAIRDTPWNTRDLEVTTPEGVRVVLTAARPFDPAGDAAARLAAIGITPPDGDGGRAGVRRLKGEHVRRG